MPVPEPKVISQACLDLLSDGDEHRLKDITESLARQFNLTLEEVAEKYPKGVRKFPNKVHVACKDLEKKGLLSNTRYGHYRKISINGVQETRVQPETPDSTLVRAKIEENVGHLREQLAIELLEKIMSCSAGFFEQLVVELMQKMGYGSLGKGYVTGGSGDGGIDGIIEEDKLGLEKIGLQAKRLKQENKVGDPVVTHFIGSMRCKNIRKGVLITTSEFTSPAIETALANQVKLIDGKQLAELMIEYDLGVNTESMWILKQLDDDYFEF